MVMTDLRYSLSSQLRGFVLLTRLFMATFVLSACVDVEDITLDEICVNNDSLTDRIINKDEIGISGRWILLISDIKSYPCSFEVESGWSQLHDLRISPLTLETDDGVIYFTLSDKIDRALAGDWRVGAVFEIHLELSQAQVAGLALETYGLKAINTVTLGVISLDDRQLEGKAQMSANDGQVNYIGEFSLSRL